MRRPAEERSGASWRACSRARPTATTASSRSMPGPAAPNRRTGPRCCCACTSAGRSSGATASSGSRRAPARKRESSRPSSRFRARAPTAGSKPRAACTAWSVSPPSTRARGAIPASPPSGSSPWWTRPSTSRSSRRTSDRHLPGLGRGRSARQPDRQRGPHHPPAHQYCRPVPGRALAAPQQGRGHVHAARPPLRARAAGARERGAGARRAEERHRLGPPDPLLRAAALSHGEGRAHGDREQQPRRRARRGDRPLPRGVARGPHRRPGRGFGKELTRISHHCRSPVPPPTSGKL
ncbi:hypothetical protein GBAR_LOCUS795 [Geodia barretti]|uniref:Uncharacterized protein n=1 Tax=Geodia barretti TaxID=519541 RepID=A0AA35QUA7_GEOBA|nr:hypothetical protein GBAR_LOCUS795 [Geodia barretti]